MNNKEKKLKKLIERESEKRKLQIEIDKVEIKDNKKIKIHILSASLFNTTEIFMDKQEIKVKSSYQIIDTKELYPESEIEEKLKDIFEKNKEEIEKILKKS